MLRLNRLVHRCCSNRASVVALQSSCHEEKLNPLSSQCSAQKTSIRFLDIYQMGNKSAIEKERARLSDEMSRGYFADMSELKKHGGKIAMANKIIIPAAEALKFPDLEVIQSGGVTFKLPPVSWKANSPNVETSSVPKASLVCLSFRASSQAMIDSWSLPFHSSFSDAKNIHLYEVSFIDSWLLCRGPIKRLLLRFMRKNDLGGKDGVKRQIAYSFGDHYYFRKELKILNLLTGYIFLLDKFGRIRWQGSGMATEEEMSSLVSCTSIVLKEKWLLVDTSKENGVHMGFSLTHMFEAYEKDLVLALPI